MKFATSAGVALGLSFLFYDQRDVGEESYRGQPARMQASPEAPQIGGGTGGEERSFLSYGAGFGGGKLI